MNMPRGGLAFALPIGLAAALPFGLAAALMVMCAQAVSGQTADGTLLSAVEEVAERPRVLDIYRRHAEEGHLRPR